MRSSPFALAAALLFLGAPLGAQGGAGTLTVHRIWGAYDFAGDPMPDIAWLPDGESFITARPSPDGGDDLVRVEAATGRTTLLARAGALLDDKLHRIEVEGITLSADGTKALIYHDAQRVWRLNTKGVYSVVDFSANTIEPLSHVPGLQMFATFSPDGEQVAFVRHNDLYVRDLATGRERALTTDGSDTIINGTTDWVYEEEFDLRKAFAWSPDSKHLVFWRFDQSAIPSYPLLDDSTPYPTIREIRYPTAGAPNSSVRIGVVTVATGAVTWMHAPGDTTAATGGYIPRVGWAGNDSVVIQHLPRLQNRIDLLMASAATGGTRLILTEQDTAAWVDVPEAAPYWVDGGRAFLWPSERSGWRQYYLFARSGKLLRRVTRDSVDVTRFAGVDEQRKLAYVIEAGPTPRERQMYAFDWRRRGAGTRITREPGVHEAQLAPGARWFLDVRSRAGEPPVAALERLPRSGPERVLVSNADLRESIAALHITPPQFFQIPLPDGERLDAYRIIPPGFDSTRRYPVLMNVYGGPGSQTVLDGWGGEQYMWNQMLAQRGFVVVSVDGRGTGGRGAAFRHVVYEHLGIHESDDQIDAARWLARQRWVDAGRLGIWGWSYGGYLAAMTAFRAGDLFRAAISVAPVTDWRLYDDVYTERYMRRPVDNPEGYAESSAQRYAGGLSANYLLVFGTGDDNVHPQNSVQLANRLIAAGKLFDVMIYPNRTHAIAGGNSREQLFDTLTRFVMERLGGFHEEGMEAALPGPRR